MDNTYPDAVLQTYGLTVESIIAVDEAAEEISSLLDAIEILAEGDGRCDIIAVLARLGRVRLAMMEEATIHISEYCRAADVARERATIASEASSIQ